MMRRGVDRVRWLARVLGAVGIAAGSVAVGVAVNQVLNGGVWNWWALGGAVGLAAAAEGGNRWLVHLDRRSGEGLPAGGPARSARVVVGVVPREADCFQDRGAYRLLERAVAERGAAVLSQVLNGMGGVGKTQLAAAYARNVPADVLVWVSATSRTAIISAYAEAAERIGLATEVDDLDDTDVDDLDDSAGRFLTWAADSTSSWLVVLDDVQDPSDLNGLWPEGRTGRVLVTTRRRDAALTRQDTPVLTVGLFTEAESLAYLTAKLTAIGTPYNPAEFGRLAEDLGQLPLALAQAAAYIVDAGLDCAEYRTRLADRRRTLIDVLPEPDGLPDEHRLVVAATWSLSIEQANASRPAGLARPVLALASLLDPNGLPGRLLGAAVPDAEPDDLHDALRVLHRFSLLDYDRDNAPLDVRVHRLVQRATRESLTPHELAALAYTAADALAATGSLRTVDLYAAVLRANVTALRATVGPLLFRRGDEPHPVLIDAASGYGRVNQFERAAAEYADLAALSSRELGPAHIYTFIARLELARWQSAAGDPAAAVTSTEDILADVEQALPPGDLIFYARLYLARRHGETGDHATAAAMIERLLPDLMAGPGPTDVLTLDALDCLTENLRAAGDRAAADRAHELLFRAQLDALGPDHSDTQNTAHNLGVLRANSGDGPGAVAIHALLTERMEQTFGTDDARTLRARGALAVALGEAGDPATAVAALTEILTLLTELPQGDPRTSELWITSERHAYWSARLREAQQ